MLLRQVSLNPQGNPFREEWNLSCGWIRSGAHFVKTGPGEADGSCATASPSPPA
jgi:hypothetical protein